MKLKVGLCVAIFVSAGLGSTIVAHNVSAHGDVTPQAVDTSSLPKLGNEWLEENPWRDPSGEYWKRAIEVGASGYNQNCARCHGLGAVSGGLSPDLRLLPADIDGDEWYLERYQNGYTQSGITKMPAFGELLGQEAAWAIRTYVETRADPDSIGEHLDELQSIRKSLQTLLEGGGDEVKVDALKTELRTIAGKIETASEAPRADSVADNAADVLDGTLAGLKKAVEVLTVGLSAAK